MLGSIRKFSSTIFAKVFLFIVAIPFVFWGMGPVFQGGKQNTIVEIGKDKISTQEFIDYIKLHSSDKPIVDKNLIEEFLSNFIGEKLIAQEIEYFDIKLSDNSLSKIIKNEKIFIKNDQFSRIEYEKFLVKNSLTAATLESNITRQEKKNQLLEFVGGGISPPYFLVNIEYDKINQKRNIELINLNNFFKKKLNFTENQIKKHYDENIDQYKDIFKSIKFIILNPKKLTGVDDFSNLFFEKIDEIDDLIVEGKNLDFILNRYNLESSKTISFNKLGIDKNLNADINITNDLVKKIFAFDENEPTVLVEDDNKYYVIEVIKTERMQKNITNESVRKEILLGLKKKAKRKLIAEIASKINENNFNKADFDKLSRDEDIVIKKIKLDNKNDVKVLKKELVNEIYAFSERKVIIVSDIGLSENFLIYINKIEKTSIDKNSNDYLKYLDISKVKIANNLYNTYDFYLKNKYKININYKALDKINNYFR